MSSTPTTTPSYSKEADEDSNKEGLYNLIEAVKAKVKAEDKGTPLKNNVEQQTGEEPLQDDSAEEGEGEGTTPSSSTPAAPALDEEKKLDTAKGNATATDPEASDEYRQTFPEKLFQIVDKEQTQTLKWNDAGDALVIASIQDLVEDVLPNFFRQSKFQSFVRRLNRWGFRQLSKGPKSCVYQHPLFKKGRSDLVNQIRCIPYTSLVGGFKNQRKCRVNDPYIPPTHYEVPSQYPYPPYDQTGYPMYPPPPPYGAYPAAPPPYGTQPYPQYPPGSQPPYYAPPPGAPYPYPPYSYPTGIQPAPTDAQFPSGPAPGAPYATDPYNPYYTPVPPIPGQAPLQPGQSSVPAPSGLPDASKTRASSTPASTPAEASTNSTPVKGQ